MKPLNLFSFSDFQSKDVVDIIGHEFGSIKDVLIHPSSHKIILVVISHGGFAGTDIGGDYIAIPWPLVRVNPNTNTCMLQVSRDRIKNAPHIDYDKLIGGDEKVLEDIFTYYGYPEFWKASSRPAENIKTAEPVKDKHQKYMGYEKDLGDVSDDSKLSNNMDFDKLTGK